VKFDYGQKFHRVLAPGKGGLGGVEPVVQAGQQKAHRRTPGEDRQCLALGRFKRSDCLITVQERARPVRVELSVAPETPGIEADSNIVGESIIAGEIEIDHARKFVFVEKDIIGKQIGVDNSRR
jgi:hypothetical protein